MSKVTHERRGHIVHTLAQPAVLDKDDNVVKDAILQSYETHKSINDAKRFMRTLPLGAGRVVDKLKPMGGILHLRKKPAKRGAK